MATKEQRQNKRYVEMLLQIKGIDYDDWVDEIHTEFIQSNNDLIFEGLKLLNKQGQKQDEKEKKQEVKSDKVQEEKTSETQHQSFNSVSNSFQ